MRILKRNGFKTSDQVQENTRRPSRELKVVFPSVSIVAGNHSHISHFKWERHPAAINSAMDNPPETDYWA
jgi:hypothetical protein